MGKSVISNFILTFPHIIEGRQTTNCPSTEEKQRKKEKEKIARIESLTSYPKPLKNGRKESSRISNFFSPVQEGVGATMYIILGLESPIVVREITLMPIESL